MASVNCSATCALAPQRVPSANAARGDITGDPRDPASLKVACATALARAGYVSRAAKAFTQGGLQSVSPDVVEQLRASILQVIRVDSELLSKIINTKLKNGSAPGPSGWTGELIASLVDDPGCLEALGVLVCDILNGSLDDPSRELIMASLLIAGAKASGGVSEWRRASYCN